MTESPFPRQGEGNSPQRRLPSGFDAERAIIGFCLVLAATLAWIWLWRQHALPDMAGMEMTGMDTTRSGMTGMAIAASQPPLGAIFLMWTLMMVAMMLPSAMPMVLVHARLMKATPGSSAMRIATTAVFALAYLLVWALASLSAALAQRYLIDIGLVSSRTLMFGDPVAAGCLLIAAGFYQLTPLKRRCLERCRAPLSFLMRGWRPDMAGALRLGLRHGLYCLGCCWLLMTLLFVGGVMNLGWVVLLAFIVLAEKLLPGGRVVALAVGIVAIVTGIVFAARGFGAI